jgi:hypothetical protein
METMRQEAIAGNNIIRVIVGEYPNEVKPSDDERLALTDLHWCIIPECFDEKYIDRHGSSIVPKPREIYHSKFSISSSCGLQIWSDIHGFRFDCKQHSLGYWYYTLEW